VIGSLLAFSTACWMISMLGSRVSLIFNPQIAVSVVPKAVHDTQRRTHEQAPCVLVEISVRGAGHLPAPLTTISGTCASCGGVVRQRAFTA
jgi:hypothetical protein